MREDYNINAYAYRAYSSMTGIDILYVSNSLEKLKEIPLRRIINSVYDNAENEVEDPFGDTASEFKLEIFDDTNDDEFEYLDYPYIVELYDGRIAKIVDSIDVRI